MARLSSEQQIQRILQAIRGWEKEAPDSTFSRRTLAQFKEAMQPSLAAQDKVIDLRKQLHIAVIERNSLAGKAMQILYTTGFAVRGDPAHGPDSALNEAFGYTRETVRRAKIGRAARRKRTRLRAQNA
jgi:hypothetical protein